MARIRLEDLTKRYGATEALQGVSLEVPDGEFLVFLGPSGCGKSTLLHLVAGLEAPTRGRVYFDGEDVTAWPPARRQVAMVFQSYALYPHKSVFENIAFPLRVQRLPRPEISGRVEAAAARLGLTPLLRRKPRQLSGGERQRVALARALVREPRAFLLDEPLSNLDAQLRVEARRELKRLQQALGTTFLYVTHDQAEALTLADRVAVLRAGRLEQVAPPQTVYEEPANLFVARFVGSPPLNCIAGKVTGGIFTGGGLRLPLPPGLPAAVPAAVLGLRPETLRLVAPDEAPWTGPVVDLERLGAEAYADVRVGAVELRVRADPEAPPAPGSRVGVLPDPRRLLLFDAPTGRRLGRTGFPPP